MGLLFLKDTERDQNSKSFDVPGIVLLSGTLFLLLWALIKAPDYGWGDTKTLGFLGATLVVGLLFVLRESRTKEPLLPLRLFRSLPLSAGTVLMLMLSFDGCRRTAGQRAHQPVRSAAPDRRRHAPDGRSPVRSRRP
ncbi:hypothetical protein [Streptomyces sp. HD]|uniref:hypothetical protein n=1 Tax=Streptomyces sp. HD TaxID=3020892 RepID=UPI00232A9FE6|nr:hypothetical protein [Streptomyces sp. HD]MDC0770745.1 hypothetical protein [Streptomyces sp. HD]